MNHNIELFRKPTREPVEIKKTPIKKFEKFNKNDILYQQRKKKVKLVGAPVHQERKIVLGTHSLKNELIKQTKIFESTNIPPLPNNDKKKLMYDSSICSKNLNNYIIQYNLPMLPNDKIFEIRIYSNLDNNITIKLSIDSIPIPKSNILWNRNWVTINYVDGENPKNPKCLFIESKDTLNIKGIYCCAIEKNHIVTDNINLACNMSNKVTTYKKNKVNNIIIGIVADIFTFENIDSIFNCIYIKPDHDLINTNFDIFFCESAWAGIDEQWRDQIFESPKKILRILEHCKKKKIPTVFYAKEDPIFFDGFKNSAILFDMVITTSLECVTKYRELGCKNVMSTTFLINPIIHNPIKTVSINKIAFPGSYYNFLDNRCNIMDIILNNLCNNYSIDIYDRKYMHNKAAYQIKNMEINKSKCEYPDKFTKYIKPSLTYSQVIDNVYKKYKCVLNINTVSDSKSMFSRRVMELAACGTNIISNESLGMKNIFGNNIYYLTNDNKYDLEADINMMPDTNIRLYELVHKKYTYKHLFRKIFDHFKLNVSMENKVCVLTNHDISIDDFIKTEFTVFYDEKIIPAYTFEWIIVLNKKNYYYDKNFIDKLILPIEYVEEHITVSKDNSMFKFNLNNIDKNTFILNVNKIKDYNIFTNNLTDNFTINNIYNPLRENCFDYTKYYPATINNKIVNKNNNLVPVIMCVWNRIDNLEKQLENLNCQKYNNFHLYIWNNNYNSSEKLNNILNNNSNKFNVSWCHSKENIGGFARFVLVKYLLSTKEFPFVIFIDDDQILSDNIFSQLIQKRKLKHSLHWSGRKFNENSDYWNSWSNIFSQNKKQYNVLDYGGTGTMITDTQIFTDESFYYLNKRFVFVEDLWYSYYATKIHNYKLLNCSYLDVKTLSDGKDQSLSNNMKNIKNIFLDCLRKFGEWNV
ncbi:glycosyltransferases group 1 [Catovirus CTV1]|uniref:Glycosyltransferases group 1 n=1 Tax=Catovirus CTV1 TaxID=1977631 RepID=A0A1V0SAE6_9VIRU|nr:glycosyltransferases group 1 [Catovirus CTV1]